MDPATDGDAMDIASEITFHNMGPSVSLRADILKRIAKLEKFYGRLTSCRVSIEARSKHHRTGNIYEVHIEMQAPGGHLVVSREPHHVKERRAHTNCKLPSSRPSTQRKPSCAHSPRSEAAKGNCTHRPAGKWN